jgi:putative transposase
MPKSRRLFVGGGIYHVCNRVTRGERALGEDPEAERLLDVMREVKQRHGLVVLAWCIMSNHYHLAIRCTGVPLWRSMASNHVKVTKGFNARSRVYGPFWLGRYRAKLVEDSEHLRRLLLYVLLNPVAAGVVKKPEQHEHVWSGHREVVRNLRQPFVDPDQLLLVFGETHRDARRSYMARSGLLCDRCDRGREC